MGHHHQDTPRVSTGPLTIAPNCTQLTSSSTAGWTHSCGKHSQCDTTQGGKKPKGCCTHNGPRWDTRARSVMPCVWRSRTGRGRGLSNREGEWGCPRPPGLERTRVLIWVTSYVGVCAAPSTGTSDLGQAPCACYALMENESSLFKKKNKTTNQFCLSTGPGRPSDFRSSDTTGNRTARGSLFLQSLQVGTRRARINGTVQGDQPLLSLPNMVFPSYFLNQKDKSC